MAVPRLLGPKQRNRFRTIRSNRGAGAARDYRSKIADRKGISLNRVGGTQPSKPATSPDSERQRVLGPKQRKKFRRIRSNIGKPAARSFRRGIASKKGITLPGMQQPVADEVAEPTPDETQVEQGVEEPTVDPVITDENKEVLFPSMDGGREVTKSPFFDFQADEGQRRLERFYAARGHRDSEVEDEGMIRFLNELGAQEVARQSDVWQTEADRLERLLENQALRGERAGNTTFDQIFSLLNLMQQQNPMDYGYDATKELANIDQATAKQLAGILAEKYPRLSQFVSGGGGAQPVPEFVPPYPDSLSSLTPALLDAIANQGNSSGMSSSIGDMISSIISGLGK